MRYIIIDVFNKNQSMFNLKECARANKRHQKLYLLFYHNIYSESSLKRDVTRRRKNETNSFLFSPLLLYLKKISTILEISHPLTCGPPSA